MFNCSCTVKYLLTERIILYYYNNTILYSSTFAPIHCPSVTLVTLTEDARLYARRQIYTDKQTWTHKRKQRQANTDTYTQIKPHRQTHTDKDKRTNTHKQTDPYRRVCLTIHCSLTV